MPESLVIIHERLGTWARQLRPRFSGRPVRWTESRSRVSLLRAARLSSHPIFVIDLGDRPIAALEDLAEAMAAAPSALSVVLDPGDRPEFAELTRELGATLVLGGLVLPPVLERLLGRWIPLSIERMGREGWSKPAEPEGESWENPDLAVSTRS